MSSYADDAFFTLRNATEAAVERGALEDFAAGSGLTVNVQKCGVLAAGTSDARDDVGFPYVSVLKVLGVSLSKP